MRTDKADLIIISCGKTKAPTDTIAARMYVGPYHRALLTYATSLGLRQDQLRILSALYGLVPLDRVIAPYDKRLGQEGSITRPALWQQARDAGLLDRRVLVLGGRDYVELVQAIWPDAWAPLQAYHSMGDQGAVLGRNHGRWPDEWDLPPKR